MHLIVVLALALAGAAQTPPPTGTTGRADEPEIARATLQDRDGRSVGSATLEQGPTGVLIKLELTAVTPGPHAFHLHEVGRCDRPSFESAGSHFAQPGEAHGLLAEERPHAGDLPNMHVPVDGRLSLEVFADDVTLEAGPGSLFDEDGSSLVVHADVDDYTTDPAGDAGDRIACGAVTR